MANLKYKDKNTNTWQSILLTRGATGPQGPAGKNAEISLNGEINQEIAIYAPVDAGISGQVLTSKGEGQAPEWKNVAAGSGSSNVYTVDNLNAIEINSNEALSAHQGYVLNQNKVEKSTTIAGLPLTKNISVSELNDSLKTISSDGSIAKIIELTYAEYKTLESNNQIQSDTEYHITDVENGTASYITEEQIQEMINDSIAADTEKQTIKANVNTINSILANIGDVREATFSNIAVTERTTLTTLTLPAGIWVITAHCQYQTHNLRWYLSISNAEIQMGAYDNSGWVDGQISGIVTPTANTTYTLLAWTMDANGDMVQTTCSTGYLRAVRIK